MTCDSLSVLLGNLLLEFEASLEDVGVIELSEIFWNVMVKFVFEFIDDIQIRVEQRKLGSSCSRVEATGSCSVWIKGFLQEAFQDLKVRLVRESVLS